MTARTGDGGEQGGHGELRRAGAEVVNGVQPCTGCGAPLASDQRYCMYCGTRRSDARLEFLDALAAEPRVVAPPAAPPPEPKGWLQANTGALALAAVVLTTLLIGLLVGHWISSDGTPAAQAPAPQVIRITGAAPTATTATTPPATTTTTPAPTTTPKQTTTTTPKTAPKKKSKTAPITTGSGPPPKKDDKPAGNGTSFETIG
jgi:hypothetical protein